MDEAVALAVLRNRFAVLDIADVGARRALDAARRQGRAQIVEMLQAIDRETPAHAPAAARRVWRRRRAGSLIERGIFAESRKAEQAVVVTEHTSAGDQGQFRRDVEFTLAKQGPVLVLAVLQGQPQGSGPTIDRQVRSEIVDQVILVNVVGLPLVEAADDRPRAPVAGS